MYRCVLVTLGLAIALAGAAPTQSRSIGSFCRENRKNELECRLFNVEMMFTSLVDEIKQASKSQSDDVSSGQNNHDNYVNEQDDHNNDAPTGTIINQDGAQQVPEHAGDVTPPAPIARHHLRSCGEWLQAGYRTSGVYVLRLAELKYQYCDMETQGGGWTVVQRRFDGSVDFRRGWEEYKYGFGDVHGEHWLGNEYLHLLTAHNVYSVRFDLTDWDDVTASASYHSFHVNPESDEYRLMVGKSLDLKLLRYFTHLH